MGTVVRRFEDVTGHGHQLGVGMSARSRLDHVVFRNHAHYDRYLERVERGQSPVEDTFRLTLEDRKLRFVTLKLGDGKPLPVEAYGREFGSSPESDFATLVHVAIAWLNSVERMLRFTHDSTARPFCQAVAVGGRCAAACLAWPRTVSLSQSMKNDGARNSSPTFSAGFSTLAGSRTAVTRSSPNAIYDRSLATFNADASFAQGAAPGFIELYSLQSRMAYRISEARRTG